MVVGTRWTCFVDKSSVWNFLELIFVLSLFVSPFPRSPPQEPVKAAFQNEMEKWVWNHYYFRLLSYGARSYSCTGKTVGLIHPLYLFKQPSLDLFQCHVKRKGCISGSLGFSVRSCSCMQGVGFVEYVACILFLFFRWAGFPCIWVDNFFLSWESSGKSNLLWCFFFFFLLQPWSRESYFLFCLNMRKLLFSVVIKLFQIPWWKAKKRANEYATEEISEWMHHEKTAENSCKGGRFMSLSTLIWFQWTMRLQID